MVSQKLIQTNELSQSILIREGKGENILFIHGNGSNSIFWKSLISILPTEYNCIAPDLRGYGNTDPLPVDASRSYEDYVDDILSLLISLEISEYHLVSHSLGGGISWELLLKDAARIKSICMVNPASPFGFGGTKDIEGNLNFADGAGSGGGIVNQEFAKKVEEKDRSMDFPTSPLTVMNQFYWKAENTPKNINELLDGLLSMKIGDKFYPGDFEKSDNYPFVAPGRFGQINAASPLSKSGIDQKLIALDSKSPILWIRGDEDLIVSDKSMFDPCVLGAMGLIPEFPGEELCPAQPMVSQTRTVLEKYAKKGGVYIESVYKNCGHSPYLEYEQQFCNELCDWLEKNI